MNYNSKKREFISTTLLVFHFDISGERIKEWHSENILSISITFAVFQFYISDTSFSELHPKNI